MADNESHMEIDYGPLSGLVGTWQGDKGLDIAPDMDGAEENPYYETITFEAIGDVTNAELQTLVALHYRQRVSRKSNNKVFHDETGYWMWDASASVVMHSLTIPRGVCVLAGGSVAKTWRQDSEIILKVHAKLGDPDWNITQSPFMRDHARTTEFTHQITVCDKSLIYTETMLVDIYGKTFEHTDKNTLTLV